MKKIYLFIMCLISYGAYSQINVQDTLAYYQSQFDAGTISFGELDSALGAFFMGLPEEQQFTRYQKQYQRNMAFWRDRMEYSTSGESKPGLYTRALVDFLDNPICANGDDAYWKFIFDSNPHYEGLAGESIGLCTYENDHAAGIVSAIYVSPLDSNLILAGSNSAGIWRSEDGGQNWNCVTDDFRIPALGIFDIVDVSKPSQTPGSVLLAITGRTQFNDSFGVGVLRSTDGGATWSRHDIPTGGGAAMPALREIAKPYAENDSVFAISNSKIFYSTNQGISWSEMGSIPFVAGNENFYGLTATSGDENHVFVSISKPDAEADIWRANTGDLLWEDITTTLKTDAGSCLDVNMDILFDFEPGAPGGLSTNSHYDAGLDSVYHVSLYDIAGDTHMYVPPLTFPGFTDTDRGGLAFFYTFEEVSSLGELSISFNARLPEGTGVEIYKVNYSDSIELDQEYNGEFGDLVGTFNSTDFDDVVPYSDTYTITEDDPMSMIVARFAFVAPDYGYTDTIPIFFDDWHIEFTHEGAPISPSAIGLAKANNDEFYAAVQAYDSIADKPRISILHTNDNGNSWTCTGISSGGIGTQGDVLAARDNFVAGYGAEEGFYWGGVKFIRYDTELGDLYEVCSQHDDVRAIQIVKNEGGENHIIVGDDGGVAYSSDGGITWDSKNGTGLPITQFYDIAVDPHSQIDILGGTQDNGTFFYDQTNDWEIRGGGDGNANGFSPDPTRNQQRFYQTNSDISVVEWSGGDWAMEYEYAANDTDYAAYLGRPAVYAPISGNAIYEGAEGTYIYPNAVVIKHDLNPVDGYGAPFIKDLGAPSVMIGEIEVAPANETYVYIAEGYNRAGNTYKKLFLSTDAGNNYTDISNDTTTHVLDEDGLSTGKTFPQVLGWKHPNAIETNPEDATELWMGLSGVQRDNSGEVVGGLFRVLHSTDTGKTWQDYSIGLPPFPINDLIYQRGTNDRLFAATDVGVFYRDASMDSWVCFQNGMPAAFATDLEINECQQSLYAGTFGRGIWRSPIDMPVTDTTFVETDLTWGGTQQFDSHIIIESGNTLTLNGTLQMAGGTKIIVEQGAQLIVDSGVLTNLCDVFWSGVEVHGSSTDQQTATHQGKIVLRNGAIVEHARVGVALWESGNWASTGGILIASNSTFKNNKKDVEFLNYQNTDGAGGHLPNKSYFTNVTFTWDDDFLADYPLGHVTLYKVDGIKFRGCTFNDLRSEPDSRYFVDYAKTNSGIYSIDAQYFVIPQCTDYISGCSGSLEDDPDWNPTTFENLDFGVYASNISSEQNLTVDRSIFENNLYGLQTVNVNDPIITRNEFEVNGDTTNNFTGYTQRGIHLVRSKGLTVQENHFANTSGTGAVQGIVCSDLGESDEDIYRNVFDDLKYGVIAQGKNRGSLGLDGLEFLCDTNSGNFKDHLVLGSLWDTETSGEFGVKVFNGIATEPSGTVFSLDDPLPTGIHFTNDSDNELRYFFDNEELNQEPTDVNGEVYPEGTPFENACASKLSDDSFQEHSSGFMSTTLTNFNTYAADLDTALNEYQGLVNGGNTDSLLNVIAGLTRDNRDTVHTLLMSYSPYLTAEVVKATLDHPIIKYPHAWGYELVESNIEVAYTPDFFTFLENKLNPFTETMIANVQALVDSNAYTDMLTKQLEIAELQSQKANTANVLLQSIKNDTNSVDIDSVRYWIIQKGDVLAKTREIDAYLQAGDITAAESALTSLDTDLQNYPTHLQDELLDYISFKEKLIDLHQAGNSLDSLSETDHNFMTDLAENGVGLARYQAQELLCFFYGECAEYPVNPDGQQSMAPISTDTDPSETNDVERSFKIYPNPANTWVAIELPKVDEPLNITVIDLTGRLVYQKQLGGINNTDRLSAVEIWDTQLIGDGVYLITITNQNNTESFGTQRVVIQH